MVAILIVLAYKAALYYKYMVKVTDNGLLPLSLQRTAIYLLLKQNQTTCKTRTTCATIYNSSTKLLCWMCYRYCRHGTVLLVFHKKFLSYHWSGHIK